MEMDDDDPVDEEIEIIEENRFAKGGIIIKLCESVASITRRKCCKY